MQIRIFAGILFFKEAYIRRVYEEEACIISPYPSIDIDLAIVVDKKVKNDDIVNSIKKNGSRILRNIGLFDIYQGEQIEKGKKSMAYSLSFWEEDRTLKDKEVELIVNRIVGGLEKDFNASLRS